MKREARCHPLVGLGLALTLSFCSAAGPPPGAANADADATADASKAPVPAATPTPSPAAEASAFLLPGGIASTTRLADLRTLHGAANVVAGEVPGAEGETAQGAILYPDDPARRAYLYLDGDRVQTVRVFDQPSSWKLDNGIGIGTPLSEVLRRNGKPIRFYGMEWDYGGTISDWGGGALDPTKTPGTFRSLRLAAREDIGEAKYPLGDGEFSSDDKRYPTLGTDLVVGEIGVTFDDGRADDGAANGATDIGGAR